MKFARILEWGVFGGFALLIHLALFLQVPSGAQGDAGAGGDSDVSLQAMTPHLAAMIASVDLADEVEKPNAVTADNVAQVASVQATRPSVAPAKVASPPEDQAVSATTSVPVTQSLNVPQSVGVAPVAPTMQAAPAAQQVAPVAPTDQAPPEVVAALPSDPDSSALSPEVSRVPPPRPDRPKAAPEPTNQAAARDPAQRPRAAEPDRNQATRSQNQRQAAGQGSGARAGADRSGTASLSRAERRNLMAQWGSQIRTRIDRRKSRAVRARGSVTVNIVVAVNGQLAGVSVARSSGDRTLDRAAMQAVQRAGRFPKAPSGIRGRSHSFNLAIRFDG
ncbi:energy transducer TonB [Actibacterium sp. 188UL27-1]|uniref:energy transducer TonB n=1 Tax=Actibacterium sp. 188UL27-1 TaxID=2786961 RepID=UPI00195C827F|nr:energy transducer TonB [Actibacterium sp. 188UL27-1]MBM7067084.1 TonB family protein [Actibacterium sp. 188UL27-1]